MNHIVSQLEGLHTGLVIGLREPVLVIQELGGEARLNLCLPVKKAYVPGGNQAKQSKLSLGSHLSVT